MLHTSGDKFKLWCFRSRLVNGLPAACPTFHETGSNVLKFWLPGQDSNLGLRIQSPSCYHYTTGQ